MPEYQKILVATDTSEHSANVLRRAAGLAQLCEAKLLVLHVVDYIPTNYVNYLASSVDEVEEKLISTAEKQLAELLERCALPGANTRVVSGNPKVDIVRIAEREKSDLIVMGAHGHHGIAGLTGSTTSRVLHQAACDVLVVQ